MVRSSRDLSLEQGLLELECRAYDHRVESPTRSWSLSILGVVYSWMALIEDHRNVEDLLLSHYISSHVNQSYHFLVLVSRRSSHARTRKRRFSRSCLRDVSVVVPCICQEF